MNKLLTITVLLAAAPLALAAQPPASRVHPSHAAHTASAAPRMALPRFRFENFTTANGLPDNHVYSVLVDGDRIWAGTDNGLALFEKGKWKTFTTADGLAHRAVLSLALER